MDNEFDKTTIQPLIALTPLYRFSSDSDELEIDATFMLVRYREDWSLRFSPDDIFVKHLQICEPTFLAYQRPPFEAEVWHHLASSIQTQEDFSVAAFAFFFSPAVNFFRLLRLFKPGRLFAGETFLVLTNADRWATQYSRRNSLMNIDFSLLPHKAGMFSVSSAEVPFFKGFSEGLLPLLQSLNQPECPYPQLEMALELFGRDDGVDSDVLNALTAFEGILTNESTAELSYRLSLRVAHLLASDAVSRKQVFTDMRDYYDLRSKLVHGSGFKLKPKHQTRLLQIDTLREYLRRTLLSVMALYAEGLSRPQLEEWLDDIALDEAKREQVQKAADKFLHVNTTAS